MAAMRLKQPPAQASAEAVRKRAAVELIARHGAALKRTARRYSLCTADAEDAYQRALEILLTKAPCERGHDLFGWSKTVVKHEALAVRRNRERLLGTAPSRDCEGENRDPVALIPSDEDGPAEQLERSEEVARSREALRSLKPAELRALTLLAEGYSYAEIGEITGFSRTKINRSLAEGRERFRRLVARSEDGGRCADMALLLSAFCDRETSAEETATVREHLRACASCRATVRAYRTAPARVAALAPVLPASRSLLERARELLLGIQSRLPGGGTATDGSVAQVASAGGAGGAGAAGLVKVLVVCAGTVGGTAACVATGVAPVPAGLSPDRVEAPRIERVSPRALEASVPPAVEKEPESLGATRPEPRPASEAKAPMTEPAAVATETDVAEYPDPAAAPSASGEAEAPSHAGGSAAGEFGP